MIPGQFDDVDEEDHGTSTATTTVTTATATEKSKPQTLKEDDAVVVLNAIKNSFVTNDAVAGAEVVSDDEDYDDDDDDDDNDYYYDYDDQDNPVASTSATGASVLSSNNMNLQKQTHAVHKMVQKAEHLETTKRILTTDRNDRATTEQCLDPRTRLILFKLISRGFLEQVDGCLSTGKEANVYYAKAGSNSHTSSTGYTTAATPTQPQPQSTESITTSTSITAPTNDNHHNITEFAIKIYKTSILVFKDRDKYVSGEHRWRKGYCRSNPRKMVKVWAEKEMRNYRRIHAAGIPTPVPILLKSHVLIMEFLGTNGWPAPRLKDAILKEKRLREAYVQTIFIMRHMYQRCKLVHGDLSEYNLLWHNQEIYVIDVSQSVESDHPSALDFLRKDASNVNDYFSKAGGGLNVMTTRQLFEFIIEPLVPPNHNDTIINDGNNHNNKANAIEALELARLDEIMAQVDQNTVALSKSSDQARREQSQQEAVDEAVFMSSFLPRSLNQVAEYDIQKLEQGDVEESYATAVASLTGNQDVVDAVSSSKTKSAAVGSTSILNNRTTTGIRENEKVVHFLEGVGENPALEGTTDVDSHPIVTSHDEQGGGPSNEEMAGSEEDEDDEECSDDDEDDDDGDESTGYQKVARTPEARKD